MELVKHSSIIIILVICFTQIHAMDNDVEHGIEKRNAVSYIYYPSQREMPIGHAGLAVEDAIDYELNLDGDTKSLQKIIEKTTKRNGYPFFQFEFDVTSHEFEKIKAIIKTPQYILEDNCSMRALKPLIDTGICSVPFPMRMSPVVTAAYLTYGKRVGSNRVSHIKFYGGPSMIKNIAAMAPGFAYESFVTFGIAASPILIGFLPYVIHEWYSHYAEHNNS